MTRRPQSKEENFVTLMLLGKPGLAMKFVNNEDNTRGVHLLSSGIVLLLQKKHHTVRDVSNDILIPPSAGDPKPVIYEVIDGTAVYKAAKQLQGSGGPSRIDADG